MNCINHETHFILPFIGKQSFNSNNLYQVNACRPHN